MPIGDDTFATRRHLPHFQKRDRAYFITWSTVERRRLPHAARDIALACCIHDHERTYWLHVAVVMPDHVHVLITPYEQWSLDQILRRVKGVSSRLINKTLARRGPLWQDESFDRVMRVEQRIQSTADYIAMNPVRRRLVNTPADYRWLWRDWQTKMDRQDCLSSTG